SSAPICGGRPHPSKAKTNSEASIVTWAVRLMVAAPGWSPRTSVRVPERPGWGPEPVPHCPHPGPLGLFVPSIITANDLAIIASGQADPGPRIDRLFDESHRAVAEQHVATAGVVGVHLIGVAERVVRCVDDHLGVVVDIGAAVAADQVSAA